MKSIFCFLFLLGFIFANAQEKSVTITTEAGDSTFTVAIVDDTDNDPNKFTTTTWNALDTANVQSSFYNEIKNNYDRIARNEFDIQLNERWIARVKTALNGHGLNDYDNWAATQFDGTMDGVWTYIKLPGGTPNTFTITGTDIKNASNTTVATFEFFTARRIDVSFTAGGGVILSSKNGTMYVGVDDSGDLHVLTR